MYYTCEQYVIDPAGNILSDHHYKCFGRLGSLAFSSAAQAGYALDLKKLLGAFRKHGALLPWELPQYLKSSTRPMAYVIRFTGEVSHKPFKICEIDLKHNQHGIGFELWFKDRDKAERALFNVYGFHKHFDTLKRLSRPITEDPRFIRTSELWDDLCIEGKSLSDDELMEGEYL